MSVSAYLTKGGERRWRVRYSRPDGSRTDKRGFVRKKDALLWEADHVTVAKARGAYVDPAGARVATVGGLWESWIARKRLVDDARDPEWTTEVAKLEAARAAAHRAAPRR